MSIVKLTATCLLVLSLTNVGDAVKLKSVDYANMYLNPTNTLLTEQRRFVVTNSTLHQWKLVPLDGHYQIVSSKGEYLHAPGDEFKFDKNTHAVLTWLPAWDNSKQRLWDLEYDGVNVSIRNIEHNEYLCASSNEPRVDNFPRVVTRANTKCAWKIID